MARYQGLRIDEWLDAKLEDWLGLSINREKTKVVEDINIFLRGWSNYFEYGYPRKAKAFRDLNNYKRKRMVRHLNRRSQRKYHRPKGMSHYQYLEELGLQRL